MSERVIYLCAGGTGGHVFPAIALAHELRARGLRVIFLTDTRGQKYLINEARGDVITLSSATWGLGIFGKIKFIFPLIYGFFQAIALFLKHRPAYVIGFGGYPSAPPIAAAQVLGIKTALHEQNAILGAANKVLGFFAHKIFLSFSSTAKMPQHFHKKTVVIGNPVRADIVQVGEAEYVPPEGKINILIFGGSLGAKSFSTIVPQAFAILSADLRARIHLVHQVKDEDQELVRRVYNDAKIECELQPFFHDMPQRLKSCHLVIARAGASTVCENFAARRPAFYVPYPWNRDQQQRYNAAIAVEAGAAWMMEEKDLTPESFAGQLQEILRAPERLAAKAQAARAHAKVGAAQEAADFLVNEINLA
jgi:UDP-N-acetylglucosamine--N-acetylmuramyl-(pentapeptide) pyrophosphoryl-undecaprenol N-acetylglucosamine transferase